MNEDIVQCPQCDLKINLNKSSLFITKKQSDKLICKARKDEQKRIIQIIDEITFENPFKNARVGNLLDADLLKKLVRDVEKKGWQRMKR